MHKSNIVLIIIYSYFSCYACLMTPKIMRKYCDNELEKLCPSVLRDFFLPMIEK